MEKRKINPKDLDAIGALLSAKASAANQLKAIDAQLKPLVSVVSPIYDKQTIETAGGLKIKFETVCRLVPKYKEIAFELAKGHEERIQEIVDGAEKQFLIHTISYQAHLVEGLENEK